MATPTSAREWKKSTGEELKLPSGNTCLVKRPGMEKLFSAGVLPDELTKIAVEGIEMAQGGPRDHLPAGGAKPQDLDPEMMKKFLETDGAISDIFSAFDRVTAMCVIQPPVRYHMREKTDSHGVFLRENGKPVWEEIPLQDRDDENYLYTDDVDIDDKTFLFNFVVGGTRDLETFRQEFGDALATVQSGQDVEVPSVGAPGNPV